MDTIIKLGDFEFKDMEIPEKINFGGSQQLSQHNLIGGGRVIDALGKNDMDITWSGLFTGQDALSRVQQLNKMRADGQQLSLTWFNLKYNVIIQNLEAQTERYYQVAYTITLRVILDGTNPNSAINLIGFNEAIHNDFAGANALAESLDDPNITSTMSVLNTAIDAVATFNGASPATIATITAPLNAAIDAVTTYIGTIATALWPSGS